ncbi:hypothetical protein E2P81_ATG03884 [Venturia nashicola]|uniref:Uncharacterized protein n=1 Tax=Venturia nashicola TaxID=86259 RepID=A0A4Z1PSN9_9PEZI|nr:hypothetical protein E6O75_ATG03975 [Venturia nashicola]TLD38209.1 hypothetical protein E2P81_ATG03884 [Venturia nashicola]
MKPKFGQRSRREVIDEPLNSSKKAKRTNSAAREDNNGQELPPPVILAREVAEHLAQCFNNAAFKDLPQETRLLVARSHDKDYSEGEEDEENEIFTGARRRTREGSSRRSGKDGQVSFKRVSSDLSTDKPNTQALSLVSKRLAAKLWTFSTFEMDLYSQPFSLANLRRIKKPRMQLEKKYIR